MVEGNPEPTQHEVGIKRQSSRPEQPSGQLFEELGTKIYEML